MAGLGDLLIYIRGDNTPFKSALKSAESASKSFESAINSAKSALKFTIAGVGLHEISQAIEETIHQMDELKNRALETRTSVEDLQKIEFFGGQSGVQVDTLTKALTKMQVAIGSNKDTFEALQIKVDSLKGQSSIEQLQAIGKAILRVKDIESQQFLSREIFGRNSAQLNQLFLADIEKLNEEYKNLGLGIKESQSEQAKLWVDTEDKFSRVWRTFKQQVVSNALPSLQYIADALIHQIELLGGAKKAADDFTDALKLKDDPIQKLIRALTDLRDFNVAANIKADTGRTEGFLAETPLPGRGSTSASQSIIANQIADFVSSREFKKSDTLTGSSSLASLGGIKTNIGPEFTQDFRKSLDTASTGVNNFNKAVFDAAQALKKTQLDLGRSELERIANTDRFGNVREQAQSLRFDNLARMAREDVNNKASVLFDPAGTARLLSDLKSIAEAAKARGQDTKNMDAVIALLNEDLSKTLNQQAPKFELGITLSDGLKAEFKQQQTEIAIRVNEKKMSDTAAAYGSR